MTFAPADHGKDRNEIYQDAAGKWRWRRLAPNGEIIASSNESYPRKWNAWRAARRVFRGQ